MADDFSLSTIASRLAGHAWDDIHDFLDGSSAAALDAGYSPEEIDDYLGRTPPNGLMDRLGAAWRVQASDDPKVRAPLDNVQPEPIQALDELPASRIAAHADVSEIPPVGNPENPENVPINFDTPGMREHYAEALNEGSVRSAQDFAERYAGSYWGAMGGDANHGAAVTRSATALAHALPSDDDFTDAAIAVAGHAGLDLTPAAVKVVKDNLVNAWADTSAPPMELYQQTVADPGFERDMAESVKQGVSFSAKDAELQQQGRDAIEKFYFVPGEELPDSKSVGDAVENFVTDAAVYAGAELAGRYIIAPLVRKARDALGYVPEYLRTLAEGVKADVVTPEGEVVQRPLLDVIEPPAPAPVLYKKAAGHEPGEPPPVAIPAPDSLGHPPIPEGKVRLYRVEGGDREAGAVPDWLKDSDEYKKVLSATGRWFTNDFNELDFYRQEAGAQHRIVHVDVPAAEAEAYRVSNIPLDTANTRAENPAFYSARPEKEFFLPSELAAAKKELPVEIEPTATPAAKLQALARDAGDRPTSIETLAVDQDPATRELARASDAAGALRSFFMDTLPKVVADDAGTLRLRTPAQVQAAGDRAEGRDFVRELIVRNMVGNAQRDIAHYADLLEPHYPVISKNMGEWESELAKGPAGSPMSTPIGTMLDYTEGRSAGAYIDPNSPLKPVADTIRDINQALDKRLRQQAQDGLINYDGFIQDYYAHQWKDPNAVRLDTGTGKLGTGASLQQRTTFPTLADGIRAGYEPRFANPIEATVHDVQGKMLYSHAADMIDEAEQAGHIYWARQAANPADMRINGSIGTRQRPIPSTTNPGQTVLQDMYAFANEGFARNMNDWLSRGLYDRPSTASMLDKMMYAKNVSTAFKLALPLFHSITVSIGSLASGIGQAMEQTARGQFLGAVGNISKVATIAPNLIENSVVGLRAIRRYTDLANDPIIKSLTEAGLSFAKPLAPEAGYSFGTNSIYTSWQRGTLGREIAANIRSIGGDPKLEEGLYRAVRVPDRILQAGITEAGRLMSTVTSPVFDTLIPALKVGSSYRRMQSFIDANPTASAEAVSRYAKQVATDVDNRLGELNLDTVFWPKTAKQIINAATISTSWAYGTYRGLMAAAGYNVERRALEWNPVATSSLVGTAAVFAYGNSLMQYLHTGQTPLDTDTPFRDLMNFRTGGTTKTGAPERGMIPSELKELFDLAKVSMKAYSQFSDVGPGLVEYALAKANPFMQVLLALVTGKDGIGHNIAEMPGGWGRFFTENQMPIFMQQLANRRKGTELSPTENVIGVREASKYVTDPPAYLRDLAGVHDRAAKQEAYRYRKETADREDPTPAWGDPIPAKGRGGARTRTVLDPNTGVTREVLDPNTGPPQTNRAPSRRNGGGGRRGGGRQSRAGGGRSMVRGGAQGVGGGAQGV